MHRFALVLLIACGGAPPAPSIASSALPPAGSPSKSTLDPAIAKRLAGAELVVRGRAHVAATRDGHLGSIAVDAILLGIAPMDIGFVSVPVRVDEDQPAIYLLRREGDRYRAIEQDDRLGLDVALEPAIIAHLAQAPAPRAAWDAAIRAHAADLDTFRRGAGKPWTPAEAPAVAAAAKVFAEIPWIGIDSAAVRQHLGPADEVKGDTWQYIRHQGEAGQIRVLHFAGDRVIRIEVHRTQ
jgi:hypothetical protein